jgi:NADH dehydrogenase
MVHDIVLLGGSGFVGSRLCELLVGQRDGAPRCVTVATRRRAHAGHLQTLSGVEVQEADVHDDGALGRLVTGRGAVVNLVGILHGDQAAFSRVHAVLPRRVAAACRHAGVQRLVHVSALGADGGAPSMYLRSKSEGESAIVGGGVPGAILRPSVMFGERDRFLNLFARLSRFAPVIPLAGAQARFQPVWVDDVARAIIACLQARPPASPIYECAGPQVYTLMELVRGAGRYSGHERLVIPLPAAVAKCQAWFMEHLPGEPLISRDNLASMQVPNVASGRLPGLAELGISPASLDAVAPSYLA